MSGLEERQYWAEKMTKERYSAQVQKLQSELEKSVAPEFRGARLTREDFKAMMTIPEREELTVFVPVVSSFVKMHFGDGTNSDSLCEGCDDYLYYTVYNLDFEEVDGGQLDFNTYESHYCGDIRKAAVDVVMFAFSDLKGTDVLRFIPLAKVG